MRRLIVILLNVLTIVIGGIVYGIGYLAYKAAREPFIALGGIATIIYAVFAYKQWLVMGGQLEEMRTDNRAWASADIEIADGFIFDPANPIIELTFHYKNTGKSPAMEVNGLFDAIPIFDGTNAAVSRLKAVCNNSSVSGPRGFQVFPGDTIQGNQSANISVDDAGLLHRLNPIILTCIAYKPGGDEVPHFTARTYELAMKAPRPGKGCCAIDVADGPVTKSNLNLTIKQFKGANFAN
jgi:hypothetical protein